MPNSVDVGTETAIRAAMERLMHGRTTVMIAQRLSRLEICAMKLVLADGDLVEYGASARRNRSVFGVL